LREARDETRQAWSEARDEVRRAYRNVLAADDSELPLPPSPPASPLQVREQADGIPVPIVPWTRVTDAEARPPASPSLPPPVIVIRHGQPPKSAKTATPMATTASDIRTIKGLISATEERATAEARRELREQVLQWLGPEVSGSWTAPERLLQAMILETRVSPNVRDYGTLYVGELKVDFSPPRRIALLEAYNHEMLQQRLAKLTGALAFVLICLAAVSGYIRADEATKGYYTNRLRMLALGGVSTAGVIIYQIVS
jgi:hypothetical protein